MDEVPTYSREQVIAEVVRWFGEASVKGVMLLLDEYQLVGGGRERVQMAILKLSKGNLHDVRHYITQAQDDVRDVLYWAEYYGT